MLDRNARNEIRAVQRVRDMELGVDNHHYITLSHLYTWMKERALPEASGILLDYGCGGQPYKALFMNNVIRYIGADTAAAEGVDLDVLIEPGQPLPLSDSSVDTILSTQTLEHVKDFHFYLAECNRLLRPGGILILTAPMQWRHHEAPHDYFRFTRYGLIASLGEHNFEIRDLTSCGGAFALIGQILLNHLAARGIRRKFIFMTINYLALWLDKKFPDSEETVNWMCIAARAS